MFYGLEWSFVKPADILKATVTSCRVVMDDSLEFLWSYVALTSCLCLCSLWSCCGTPWMSGWCSSPQSWRGTERTRLPPLPAVRSPLCFSNNGRPTPLTPSQRSPPCWTLKPSWKRRCTPMGRTSSPWQPVGSVLWFRPSICAAPVRCHKGLCSVFICQSNPFTKTIMMLLLHTATNILATTTTAGTTTATTSHIILLL